MRFRTADFDIPMPTALVGYWTAWNETDLSRLGQHLAGAVTQDVEWNDPRDSFRGIEALEANMRNLRTTKPLYRFRIASEIDAHHNRLRYRWDMVKGHRTLMEGLDVVTLCATTGLIERVDGFFGEPTALTENQGGAHMTQSGVPERFRAFPTV